MPFYKLDKKPLQIYSDRVRVLRQEAKLLAEVYIGNIAEVYIGNGVIPNTARVIRSS